MKIAILYICTGKYVQFFDGFYSSCMKNFLAEEERTLFVWSDDPSIATGKDNVILSIKKCEGFPIDSLFRFQMFLNKEKELEMFDYIFFFNSNAYFIRPVNYEILPDSSGLCMGVWPGKRSQQHPMFYPYERNKRSLAYIKPHLGKYYYYMGGLNGGAAMEYLNMVRTLAINIMKDYNNGIIARVHDESHINAYMIGKECKRLGWEFCLPEEWIKEDDKPKIIFRDKVRIDAYFNKNRKRNLMARAKKGLMIVYYAIKWYI